MRPIERVICRGSLPSGRTVQRSAVRCDVLSRKATLDPSGEKLGEERQPLPRLTTRACPPPSERATTTSRLMPPPSLRRYTSQAPSGDHAGEACSLGSYVIGVTRPVSTSTTPTWGKPLAALVTAMRVPSGDHTPPPMEPSKLSRTRGRGSPSTPSWTTICPPLV